MLFILAAPLQLDASSICMHIYSSIAMHRTRATAEGRGNRITPTGPLMHPVKAQSVLKDTGSIGKTVISYKVITKYGKYKK